MEILRAENPGVEISATLRCGGIRQSVLSGFTGVRVLPFGSEADVEADMHDADLLYMPLPFGAEDACFVRYSLSTKMITYLGSGIPILYHGPREAAAWELLSENAAAFTSDSPDPESVAATLREAIANPASAGARVAGALGLARRRFVIEDQRREFWGTIQGSESAAQPAVGAGTGGTSS